VCARRKVERRRHHADDGVGLGVQLDALADHAGRAPIVPLPERLAEDGDAIGAWCPFFRREHPADERAGAQHREQVCRGPHARHVERLAAAGERVPQLPERCHRRHRTRLLLPVEERERRDQIGAAVRILFPQHHQARRVLVGELVQQDGLDHAEDGGVGADAEHQREDRHRRERRLPSQRAKGVADIADQVAHRNSDC